MGFGQSRLISVLMGSEGQTVQKNLNWLDLIDPFWMMPIQKNTLQIHNFVVVFVVLKFSILLICNMLVTGSLHLNYHLETQYSIPLSQLLIVMGLSDHKSWTAIIYSFTKLLFGDGKLNKWVWCFVNSCWCLIKWSQNSKKKKLILQHCMEFETLDFSSQLFCDVTSISLKC